MWLASGLVAILIWCALAGPGGCGRAGADRSARAAAAPLKTVTIGGEVFRLEVAADERAHDKGLGGRTKLAPDGGMLFVFPAAQEQMFVMKDCAEPLDLIYLDEAGRVLKIYTMPPEAPRGPGEAATDAAGDAAYTSRLKGYSSDVPAQYAVEVKGGTAARLGVKVGDAVVFERPATGDGAGAGGDGGGG